MEEKELSLFLAENFKKLIFPPFPLKMSMNLKK